VRGEIIEPGKYEHVGKSQPVLITMSDPMISPQVPGLILTWPCWLKYHLRVINNIQTEILT
jgi:hypothetical protein